MSILDNRMELQTTARLFRVGQKTIINRSGKAVEIVDNDGFVHTLLSRLTGEEPLSEVYDSLPGTLKVAHPVEHARDTISQLDNLCLFGNKSITDESRNSLTHYQRDRWNRNFDFFAAYCTSDKDKFAVQKTIANSKVVLFGIGGVGTHALLDLVSFGFTNIKAVDFDKIELSNLNRQILYGETDVGRKKTDAASEAINRYIDPEHHNITFLDNYIDGADEAQKIIMGADIVIGCVDRPTDVVSWISEACVRERTFHL